MVVVVVVVVVVVLVVVVLLLLPTVAATQLAPDPIQLETRETTAQRSPSVCAQQEFRSFEFDTKLVHLTLCSSLTLERRHRSERSGRGF